MGRDKLVPTIADRRVVIQGCMTSIPDATNVLLTEEERAVRLRAMAARNTSAPIRTVEGVSYSCTYAGPS
jgi:hypothetical protein